MKWDCVVPMWTACGHCRGSSQSHNKGSTCGITSYSLPPTFTNISLSQCSSLNTHTHTQVFSAKSVSGDVRAGQLESLFCKTSLWHFTQPGVSRVIPQCSRSHFWCDNKINMFSCWTQTAHLAPSHFRQSISQQQTSHAFRCFLVILQIRVVCTRFLLRTYRLQARPNQKIA